MSAYLQSFYNEQLRCARAGSKGTRLCSHAQHQEDYAAQIHQARQGGAEHKALTEDGKHVGSSSIALGKVNPYKYGLLSIGTSGTVSLELSQST